MIITVTSFCKKIGKTTLALFLAEYFINNEIASKVFIIDNDENNETSKIFLSKNNFFNDKISCLLFDEDISFLLKNEFVLSEMNEDESIYIIDLKSNFDKRIIPLLKYSTFIISPFSNFISVINSTIKFGELIYKITDLNTNLIFLENFADINTYLSEENYENISNYGEIISSKVMFDENFEVIFKKNNGNGIQFKAAFDELCTLIKKN